MKKLTSVEKEAAIETIKHAYKRTDRSRDRIYKGLKGFIEMITDPDSLDRAELDMVNSVCKLKSLVDENDKILKN